MKTATLALVSLGMAGMLLCSCDNKDAATQAEAAAQEAPAITVFRIMPYKVLDTEDWFSTLGGDGTVHIHPRVKGTLLGYEYEKGALVKKGDVLFRIDPVTFQANLERAQANLKVAEAAVATGRADELRCRKDFERNEKLSPSGAISKRELEESRHALQAAEATVKKAEAQVEFNRAAVKQAELDLERTVIRAPKDGLIGTPTASAGDTVGPETELASMYNATPLNVVFYFNSERLVRLFHEHNLAEADFSALAKFQIILEDGSVYRHPGKIHAINNAIGENGMVKVEGDVDNSELELRPGMTVRVRMPITEREVLLVPQDAVVTQMLNTFVLAVDRQGVPHLIPVRRDGEYEVAIQEENGYTSTQKLVAVAGVGKPLAESLKEIGYDNPADAPVVADPLNGVRAIAVSAANSRRAGDAAPAALKTAPRSFKPVITPEMRQAAASLRPTDNPQPVEATLPPFPVKVAPLVRCDVDINEEWYGTIQGRDEAELRPNISGILEGDTIKAGSLVKKGDKLLQIEARDFEIAVEEAKATLDAARAGRDRAQASLAMARDDADRYHAMQKATPGAVSEKTVTDAELAVAAAEAAVTSAEADIAQAQAALHIAEIDLGYTTITAPFDGRISFGMGDTGSMVSPATAKPLAVLTSTNPMEVRFNVSGSHALRGLRKIMKHPNDDAGDITFDVILEDGVVHPYKGVATGIDNQLNQATGTLQVIGEVENPDAMLRSGMPVTVRAVQERIKGAWLVPARAPLCVGDSTYLLVLQKNNAPYMMPVVLRNIVNIRVKDGTGQEVLQPMQVVEPDHAVLGTLLMVAGNADNLGTLLLQSEEVKTWKELALKYDQGLTPEKFDTAYAESGCLNHRDFVLQRAGAKDEIELVAHARGYANAMELLLHEMGYKKGEQVNVVVEGTQQAAMCARANIAAGADANTLTPVPFKYIPPRTVTGSVTAGPAQDIPDTATTAPAPATAE